MYPAESCFYRELFATALLPRCFAGAREGLCAQAPAESLSASQNMARMRMLGGARVRKMFLRVALAHEWPQPNGFRSDE